jgi:hypothetical protein
MKATLWVSASLAAAALASAVAQEAAPRTAWGDPDLSGTYTSDNSIGVPLERPTQFGTRAELTDEEYAARVNANDVQIAKDRNPQPESEFSAEDPSAINASRHWLERPDVPSRATSLLVDPPNGRIPERTAAGEQRFAERRSRRGRGLPASYTDFTNYDRCLTRGVVGSMLPVIYGNGTQIVQAPGVIVIRNENATVQGPAQLRDLRVRLPRGQLGARQHAERGARRGARRAAIVGLGIDADGGRELREAADARFAAEFGLVDFPVAVAREHEAPARGARGAQVLV